MTCLDATLRLAEMAGMRLDLMGDGRVAYVTIAQRMRVIAADSEGFKLPIPFRPWLSLDDAAELATALKGAGKIYAYLAGSDHRQGFATVLYGGESVIDTESMTDVAALFAALCMACLGEVADA